MTGFERLMFGFMVIGALLAVGFAFYFVAWSITLIASTRAGATVLVVATIFSLAYGIGTLFDRN